MTDQERKIFTPSEVAKMFGISVQSLKYHRLKGHIEGTDVGNTTIYTQEQIAAANLTPEKPGPKPRQQRTTGEGEESAPDRWYSPIAQLEAACGAAS